MKENTETQLEAGTEQNRRTLLATIAGGSTALMAGCLNIGGGGDEPSDVEIEGDNENDGVESITDDDNEDSVSSEDSETGDSSEAETEETSTEDINREDFYDIDAEQLALDHGDVGFWSPSGSFGSASDYENTLSVSNQQVRYPDSVKRLRIIIFVMEQGETPPSYNFVLSGEDKDATNQTSLGVGDEAIAYQTSGEWYEDGVMTVVESRVGNIYLKVRHETEDDDDETFYTDEATEIAEAIWGKL